MLSTLLTSNFPKRTRERGRAYYPHAVTIVSHSETQITATVRGGEDYTIGLTFHKEPSEWIVSGFCTCPFAITGFEPCKHIWATILAAEVLPAFAKPPRAIAFDMDVGIDESFDDGADPDDDDLEHDLALSIKKLRRHAPPPITRRENARILRLPSAPPPPKWAELLTELARRASYQPSDKSVPHNVLTPWYVLEAGEAGMAGNFIVSLAQQKSRTGDPLGTFKSLTVSANEIPAMASELDRRICLMLIGAAAAGRGQWNRFGYSSYDRKLAGAEILPDAREILLPLLFETGRFLLRSQSRTNELVPLGWDDGPAWELFLALRRGSSQRTYDLSLRIRRGEEDLPLDARFVALPGPPSYVLMGPTLARLETHGCADWIAEFGARGALAVSGDQREALLTALAQGRKAPPIEWPEDFQVREIRGIQPQPELQLRIDERPGQSPTGTVEAKLTFLYAETSVAWDLPGACVLNAESRQQVIRDSAAESRAVRRLAELGAKPTPYTADWRLPTKRVPAVVAALLDEGWTVKGNKQLFRRPGEFNINVRSGIDWFEMNGRIDFGGVQAGLPELLAALKRGERFVRLGDGSMGMLPQDWLARNGALLGLGEVADGKLRFHRAQVGLLDALLAELPEIQIDDTLRAARQRLNTFAGVLPRDPAAGFRGTLRSYQQAGLGWLLFLREFGWGGCLADDMGLGKTVQVLAHLGELYAASGKAGGARPDQPTLAVMPRSIVFNWLREAESFAPGLRVLDFSRTDRKLRAGELDRADLVLTTYGTLRRDIDELRKREFEYVILDEAQAIKNADSQNAKAARLLRARHRLAMTGTPVENSLDDLWSILEFLNPGMVGEAKAFRAAFASGGDSGAGRRVLARLVRPFILRRRKEQVAADLPERSEQTIECEMPEAQKRLYGESRDHYRLSLLGRVQREGVNKSKIHVLEALLRLRQAACHPGLLDAKKRAVESAKTEALLPMLAETTTEGHKSLVFSQFTEFLGIVREKLDAERIPYEYLDGRTRDRQACVDRFQADPNCRVFLISLKAGGVGLNLTAADYVFILDPWWNPAVEAQAIDRTHRIGQTRRVIAYRLIARDTVEAKIIELQQRKRDLADAIITQANSLITDLTREDLDLLLS